MKRRPVVAWALVVSAIVLFRGRGALAPSLDMATGLYASVGAALLHGHLPYTTVWEYKPPGFFALYAATLALVPVRHAAWVLGTVALIATAVAVFAIGRALERESAGRLAWLAVAFFVMLSPENDATASDVELELSAFIAGALALALARDAGRWTALGSGALAGAALQCKLNALVLLPVPLVAFGRDARRPATLAAYAGGIALPIAFELVAYAAARRLSLLIDGTVGASLRRIGAGNAGIFARNAGWLFGQARILAPVLELAAFAPLRRGRALVAVWAWALAALLSVVLAGELYQRHFVVLAAPVAILGAVGSARIATMFAARDAMLARAFAVLVLLSTFALHDYFETVQSVRAALERVRRPEERDAAGRLVDAIHAAGGPHPRLFLVATDASLYDRADAIALTRYRDSEHLFDARLSRMAGVDFDAELRAIFAREPDVVVTPARFDDYHLEAERISAVQAVLNARYDDVVETDGYRIFRRKGHT